MRELALPPPLRRAGPPHRLTPSQLARTAMVGSAALTPAEQARLAGLLRKLLWGLGDQPPDLP